MANKPKANWKFIQNDPLIQRSSHTLSVTSGGSTQAYIFGGELNPREPRDNDVHIVDLQDSGQRRQPIFRPPQHSPNPRVGTASTGLDGKVYVFSGRGGVAMTAIEENGSLWAFDCSPSVAFEDLKWTFVSPADANSPYPEGRSYHAVTNDGSDTIYVHGGCPAKGRLSDLWSFNISTRSWTELSPAPGAGRGGSSIAISGGLLYRLNGFDGKTEQGGTLDIYDPNLNAWSSLSYPPNGIDGPEPRSVSCLLAVEIQGRPSLMTAFGEHDPSPLGHQGAGRMLADIWVFDIKTSKWRLLNASEGSSEHPAARGWFDADVLRSKDGSSDRIVIAGGLAEDNQRLSDQWILEFSD